MSRVQAAEFDPDLKRFHIAEYSLGELQPGEVLIRTRLCTICGSDLHTYTGRRAAPQKVNLGHEIIGTVEGWGGDDPPCDYAGKPIKKGDRVTWTMAVGCGGCFYCERGLDQKCIRLFKYGHASVSQKPSGGLASHCVLVPGTAIFRLPEALPDSVASPANCATATVAAALRLVTETHGLKDAKILILGAGMLGLSAAAQCKTAGAGAIFIADPNPSRLERAQDFGATKTLCAQLPAEISEAIYQLSDDRGADIVLDFAGGNQATETSVHAARIGGCIILAGTVFPQPTLGLDMELLVRRMLTIRGLHNYRPDDLNTAIQFLSQYHSQFPFEDLVEAEYDLDSIEQVFQIAITEQPVRLAVRFD